MSDELVKQLRERADAARSEGTATALGDALHFEEAAALLEQQSRTIAALQAQGLARPIETAPRDGTVIDVWVDGRRYADVSWCQNYRNGKPIDSVWNGWAKDGTSGQSYTPNLIPSGATHWAPILQVTP